MKIAILLLFTSFSVFCSVDLQGQTTLFDDTRVIYKKEMVGGVVLHGDGWGLNFGIGKHITAKRRRMIQFEIVGMKHPKEVKSFNPYYEDSRGYFYGKMNSFMIFRPTYGRKNQLTDKLRKSGVEVNYVWAIGPSIGFTKPIYLEIGKPSIPYEFIVTEKYDPEVHFIDDIFGRASWFKGTDELKVHAGLYAQFGLNFEYASQKSGVKAIEAGVSVDVYPKTIPIMAEIGSVENKQFFFEFYVSLKFGKKFTHK